MKCTAWVTMLRNHTWFTGGLRPTKGYHYNPIIHIYLKDEQIVKIQ